MPVLNWIHHHKLLSVGGGMAVLAVLVLGGLWYLLIRSPGTQIPLRQALLQYRDQQRSAAAPLSHGLPAPGVYSFRTTGGEQLSVAGIARSFPGLTRMVVTDRRCATVEWEPLVQHTESMVVCPTSGTGLAMTISVTHEEFAGLRTTTRIRCGAGAYVVPPRSTGTTWSSSCRAPGQTIALHGRLVGATELSVGGHSEAALHTRVTLTFSGSQRGTNPTDYWVSATDGLILREEERVDLIQPVGALGSVRFTEAMAVTLESTAPDR
jgi:hypothetical protein